MTTPVALQPASGTAAVPAQDQAQLRQAAKAFEAIFVCQMIGSMRSASLGDDLFGSSATDQFRDMQDAKLAESMAEGEGLGIATMLLRQFGVEPEIKAPAQADVRTGR